MVSGEYVVELVSRLPEFSLLIAFVAPFLGGEIAVLAVAFFAGQSVFPLWHVMLGSFAGMVVLDSFWFMVPRSPLGNKLKTWGRNFERYRDVESKIESISGKHDVLILLISKVLVGTRILILTYLALRKISFVRFTLYNSLANFLWAIALGYVGWFAGLGYYTVISAYDNLVVVGLYLGTAVAMFYGILWALRRWIIKRQ